MACHILPDATLAVVMIDIAGRGSSLRPLAYYLATNLIGLLTVRCRLERAAAIADRDFKCEFTHRQVEFAAVFVAVLDPDARRMRYVSAGHETAMVLRADRSHQHLGVTGPAFGIEPKPSHSPALLRFGPGDYLIAVTHGITDGRDARTAQFGSADVLRTAAHALRNGDDPARLLVEESRRHSVSAPDDRAAAVVSYPPFALCRARFSPVG